MSKTIKIFTREENKYLCIKDGKNCCFTNHEHLLPAVPYKELRKNCKCDKPIQLPYDGLGNF